MRRLGFLVGSCLLLWALVAYPAYLLGGAQGIIFSAVALGLCLIPALGSLLWAEWAFRKSPEMYLLMVLGGTGLRMFGVLGGSLALYLGLPYFQHASFYLWVGVFYLLTLALEMVTLLAGRT